MIKRSFTLRVLVISFVVLALPLLIDSFLFFQTNYQEGISETKNDMRQITNFRAFTFEQIQPINPVFLDELALLLGLEKSSSPIDQEALSQQLTKVAKINPNIEFYYLIPKQDDTYEIISSSEPKAIGESIVSLEFLEKIQEEGSASIIRQQYQKDVDDYTPYLYLGKEIVDGSTGDFRGILLLSSLVEKELEEIVKVPKKDPSISFALLDQHGIVLLGKEQHLEGNYLYPIGEKTKKKIEGVRHQNMPAIADAPLPLIEKKGEPFFEFIFDDEIQIAYLASIPHLNIELLAYAPKRLFFQQAVRQFLMIYTIYCLIFILGGALVYWLSIWISRPLEEFSYVMGQVEKGNFDVRFKKMPMGFDINTLGEMFNETLENPFR